LRRIITELNCQLESWGGSQGRIEGPVYALGVLSIKKAPAAGFRGHDASAGRSSEIAWTAFHPFALFAFGDILDFSIFKNGLHLDLAATGAVEVVGSRRRTGVLGYLGHALLLVFRKETGARI